ncbi:MAG: insulinase family protein [Roseivivax sp.]|nr:insulinase family protein [Roseivivax sp.]
MRWLGIVFLALLWALPARAEIKIQEVTSPGGIKAWLVEEPSIPFTALEIRFKGGASLDLPGKRGAVNLMTGLLEEGTGAMDARGFAEAVEGLAASFDYDAYDDSVAISARFLTENRDAAVDLLRASLVAPSFEQSAIDRVRGQVLSSIRSDETDPNAMAGRRFDEIAFGDHPYASSLNGTVESVTALTRQDMLDAHAGALARDRVYVGAAGDISAEQLGLLLDRLLGDLPATGLPMPANVDVKMPGGTVVVPFDTPQSVAMFGHEGIDRHDPDFIPAYVLNTILGGGGFEARLMTEVREKRGLTYGVYSYLIPKDHAALYIGQVASANDRVAEAMAVIRDEWTKMARDGVTEAELTQAKTYLTGSYALRFDGNSAIADILVGMQLDDLTPDYVVHRNDMVNAVTEEDIRRVAARILKPEALTFVVVGKPEGVQTQ